MIVGWAWDHRYVPVLFATAPIVAVAGIVFGAIALRHSAHRRSDLLALAGGGLSLLVLLGYAYAVLAYGAGGN